jgi:hypothetical protein
MPQIGESTSGVWESSKLGEIGFIYLFEIGFLFDSIVDLSQVKTFGLFGCHKLENLAT